MVKTDVIMPSEDSNYSYKYHPLYFAFTVSNIQMQEIETKNNR